MIKRSAAWIFAALVILYFAPVLTTKTLYFRDLLLHFFPIRKFVAESLRAGRLPLWNPLIAGGMPLIADPNNMALYPTTLLWLVMPAVTALNVEIVLHFLLAGLGAYVLARDLGITQRGALLAAIVFTFSGVTLSHGNIESRLFAVSWIPIIIFLLRRGAFAGAAVAGAVQIVAGAPDAVLLTWLVALAWIAVERRDLLVRAMLAAIVTALLAGIQIVPAIDLASHSARAAGTQRENFWEWSLNPRRLPEVVVNHYWTPEIEDNGFPFILSIYFGAAAIAIALLGLFASGLPPRLRVLLAAVVVVSFFFALGRFVFGLAAPPPLIASLRFPIKALSVAPLAIALLAAAGCDWIGTRSKALAAAVIVLVAADLMYAGRWVNPFGDRAILTRPDPLVARLRGGRLYDESGWYGETRLGVACIYHKEVDGLEPLTTMATRNFVNRVPWPQRARLLAASGVTLAKTTNGLLELDGARPLVAYQVRFESSLAAAVIDVADGRADHVVFARGAPPPRPGTFAVAATGPYSWRVTTSAPGFFIMSVPFDRDWKATVDGRRAALVPADFVSSTIPINAGAHDVALRYEPRSWPIGIFVSIAGVIAAILLHCRVPKMRSPSNS